MFWLYRDSKLFAGPFRTSDEAADLLQPDPTPKDASSRLWEIIDTTDSPEGILFSRVAVLRSTAGWLTYNLMETPSPP